MIPTDLRILCAALGFAAVAMKDESFHNKEDAPRAMALAGLIEEFCHATLPDIFSTGENGQQRYLDLIDELVTTLQLCLECEGRLTWAAEHDAQIVLAKARQVNTR